MTLWGYQHLPSFLALAARSTLPRSRAARARAIRGAAAEYRRVLREAGIPDGGGGWTRSAGPASRTRFAALRRELIVADDVPYGPYPAQRLTIWRSPGTASTPAPVLVFLPGGGWIYGNPARQATAMLAHLARSGWLCVGVSHRVAPHDPWPAHLEDVERALDWVRRTAHHHGGDPGFLALAGCSAGGHLASLAALRAGAATSTSTSAPTGERSGVGAAVSIYGRYDWEDRTGFGREEFMTFLEKVVTQVPQSEAPDLFRAASPVAQVHEAAPPFLVIHGTGDDIIPVEQARRFVTELRTRSGNPVVYAELPGAQHGFDFRNNRRSWDTAMAVERFLRAAYEDTLRP